MKKAMILTALASFLFPAMAFAKTCDSECQKTLPSARAHFREAKPVSFVDVGRKPYVPQRDYVSRPRNVGEVGGWTFVRKIRNRQRNYFSPTNP